MKGIKERREAILHLIEELETLRPHIEAAGSSLNHYAYSKPRAILWVAGEICIGIIIIVASLMFFAGGRLGIIFDMIMLLCAGIATVAQCTTWGSCTKTYVLASPKTVRKLEEGLTSYREVIEDFNRRKHEAEIYRPKFDQLYHIITCELKGTYAPHWQPERHFKVKIGFGKYKAEYYDLNRSDYVKLLARVIESRPEHNEQLTEFIQNCERILQL